MKEANCILTKPCHALSTQSNIYANIHSHNCARFLNIILSYAVAAKLALT